MVSREELGRLLGASLSRVREESTPPEYETRTTVEEVSPLKAMIWLARTWEKYPNGRNFYPTKLEKIRRYAADMESGQWEYRPTGDPISITDGIITGGRHRLHAILLSHTTQKCNIKYQDTKE